MAIFAKVSHKSIAASTVHRRLDSSTTVINWQQLFLHDVHVNPEATVYPLSDIFEVTESTAILFEKVSTDQFGMVESDPVFHFEKVSSDTTTLTEALVAHPNKGASDAFTFADSHVASVGKPLTDSFGFTENVHKLLTYIRSFDDSTAIIEQTAIDVSKPRSDSFGFGDFAATHPNKGLSHSTSMADSQTFDVATAYQSSTAMTEQTVMTRQPFNFVFTEASGVVTVTGEPDDSVSMTESITSFDVSAALQDYFALDDFAQVDKDVEGVKSNVFGMIDAIEFEHQITGALLNKSLVGRMVLNA